MRALRLLSMKRIALFVVLSLVIPCSILSAQAERLEYQDALLRFYTQELVAHGAMLFAASAASFRFITYYSGRTDTRRSKVAFILFGGFLLGAVLYVGSRILYYGALTEGVTKFPRKPDGNFGKYANEVYNYTMNDIYGQEWPLYSNILKTIGAGILKVTPFSIMPICQFWGFLIAYLIFYAFGCHSLDEDKVQLCSRKMPKWIYWLSFFLVPAILGIVGATLGAWKVQYELCMLGWVFLAGWYLIWLLYFSRQITKRRVLCIIAILILVSAASAYYFPRPEPFVELQIESRLQIMNHLNSRTIKTTLRAEFTRNLNFTEIHEWVNSNLIYDSELTQPRYTDPFGILGRGRGRCQEFSILYVTACLAHGYNARLIDQGINTLTLDDDHMWAEVWLNGTWIHVDPSPPLQWNMTDMYETWPWGKDLSSRIYAFEDGRYEDVTRKYKQSANEDEN